MDEVAGNYHILDHGTDTLTTARKSVEYVFNADGKIYKKSNLNNDLGTWKLIEGTNYINVTIGTKTYYGIITEMKDEANNECVVFSAISEANNSMWGVKYKQQ
jgi:arabinan endo-1,5-alpha-L-arabinosidase